MSLPSNTSHKKAPPITSFDKNISLKLKYNNF